MASVKKKDQWWLYLRKGSYETAMFGKIESRSPVNANLFLTYHPDLAGKFIYDEFSDKCLLIGSPPWIPEQEFRVKRIDDNDAHQAMLWLELQGVKVPKSTIYDCMLGIAKKNRTNPAKDFFESLEWDRTPRLFSWLETYLGANNQPHEYLEAVGKKWLTAIVSRSYEPGKKFDHMLILEGSQGTGKSTALRELATFGDEVYFYDGGVSFSDTDTLIRLQGKIIIEMAEMASFKKAINEEIKAFISRPLDTYRAPYGRTSIERPRYFVLTGSTNEKEYLPPDESGHRRYWPVECSNIKIDLLKQDREQLWAEAVSFYKGGLKTWVEEKEVELFRSQQESRVNRDAWYELIEKRLDANNSQEVFIDEVFEFIEVRPKDRDNFARKRIKDVLHQLGFFETRDKERKRLWKRK